MKPAENWGESCSGTSLGKGGGEENKRPPVLSYGSPSPTTNETITGENHSRAPRRANTPFLLPRKAPPKIQNELLKQLLTKEEREASLVFSRPFHSPQGGKLSAPAKPSLENEGSPPPPPPLLGTAGAVRPHHHPSRDSHGKSRPAAAQRSPRRRRPKRRGLAGRAQRSRLRPALGSGLQVNASLPSPQNPQAARHLGQPRDERHVTALRLLSQ